MSQAVVVPYLASSPVRVHVHDQVCAHLREAGFHPKLGLASPPWSPGKARNAGAAGTKGAVLVFNDGDSLVPAARMREAIRLAESEPGLVFAYTVYVRENQAGVPVWAMGGSASMACVAIRRDCFDEVGGFDEGYEGWGYEDLDFVRRCAERWPLRRVDGEVVHLWHGDRNDDDSPADSDPVQVAANLERWTQTLASTR